VREGAEAKGRRYLLEGRLVVELAQVGYFRATVRGDRNATPGTVAERDRAVTRSEFLFRIDGLKQVDLSVPPRPPGGPL